MWSEDDNDFYEEDRRYEAEQEAAEERYFSQLREQFMPELYEEFARDVLSGNTNLSEKIIEQFTSERLQSFYRAHRAIAERARYALEEARALKTLHPDAALVFAVIAIEVGLKTTLLKPILHGLVNIDSAAVLITSLIPDQHNDHFKKMLLGILSEVGGVDLSVYKRPGRQQTLWEEIGSARKRRNDVIHRADQVSPPEAEHAIEVAAAVLEELFPKVISALGLKTDAQLRILDI